MPFQQLDITFRLMGPVAVGTPVTLDGPVEGLPGASKTLATIGEVVSCHRVPNGLDEEVYIIKALIQADVARLIAVGGLTKEVTIEFKG